MMASCLHANSKAELSKSSDFSDQKKKKICLHVNKRPNHEEKAMFVKEKKKKVTCGQGQKRDE